MPLPKPRKGERGKSFIARCRRAPVMLREYPKPNQREAVCHSIWRRRRLGKSHREGYESQRLRGTEDPAVQARLDSAPRQMPDSVLKRLTQRALERLRNGLIASLADIANRVARDLAPTIAADQARAIFLRFFTRAMARGFVIAGLPKWRMTDRQVDALIALVDDEVEFFRNFMTELGRATEAMGRDARLDLYGGGVDDAFWRGWTSVSPATATIEWRLGVAEHCPDCLELAASSPYSKPGEGSNPLPTVPRAGETRCLANCKCYLHSTGRFTSGLINQVGVEVIGIGELAVDPTSIGALAAASLYQEFAERFAYHSRMAILEPGRGHDQIARAMERQMQALARRTGHKIRLTMTEREMLEPVRFARALGYRFIPGADLTDDLILAVAVVVSMDWSDHGKITHIQQTPATITLDGERTYRLDEIGRNILFLVE